MKMCSVFRALWLGAVCGLTALGSGCVEILAPVHVEIPLDLSKAGNTVEAEFRTWVEDIYSLELEFLSLTGDAIHSKELNGYLRDKGDKGGTIIPLHISIWKISGKDREIVHDMIVFTEGVSGETLEALQRDVTSFSLCPGKYQISVTNLENHKVPDGFKVLLFLHYALHK